MKKKSWIVIAALLFSLFSTNYLLPTHSTVKRNADAQLVLANAVDETVTMGEMAEFLWTKKEHYPLSDQFMERYQQTSGGYLDNAKKAGIPVDRLQHSPNQKWHFFTSWYYPSLADGTLSVEDDAKQRVYMKLLCPELLLWIYEACGVAPAKVKKAMEAAEAGKVAGLAVTTIAKNMRACVAWEDLAAAFAVKIPAEGVSLDKTALTLKVGESAKVLATVSPANATDASVWTVVSGEDVISITQKASEVTVRGLKEGSATIQVAYNQTVVAECKVTVEKGNGVLPPPTVAGVYEYNLVYDLGTRVTAKQIAKAEEVLAAFVYAGTGSGIIQSVDKFTYIYGGAHGGSGENKWYTGNILKFGTTSVNGSLTLHLSSQVNYVKIIGYVYDSAGKLTVGGSEFICTDMTEASKETVEGGQTSTAVITFAPTDTLTIATTNKKPLFITAIQLGYDSSLEN